MVKRKSVAIPDSDVFDSILGDLKTVSQSPRNSLPLDTIVPRNQQPRRYFDEQGIRQLAASIQEVGLLEPLVVRPAGSRFEIIAGERRYRALQHLGVERADVVIKEFDDKKALMASAIENLNREDLHPLEEVDAVITIIEASLGINRESVVQLVARARTLHRAGSKTESNSAVTDEPQDDVRRVLDLLAALGVSNVGSFYTHRLPLLNYPSDLLSAMRDGLLDFTKAKLLARVTDEAERHALLERIYSEGMTLRSLEEEVLRARERDKRPQPLLLEEFKQLRKVMTTRRIQTLDADKQKRLNSLIKEMNALLS